MTPAAPISRRYVWSTRVLLGLALVLVLIVFDDFGVTWDEPYHEKYGSLLLAYYASGSVDRSALAYHNLWLYGGAFDLLVALLKTVSPFGSYETAHLASACIGVLGALGAARIATLLAGPRAGLAAAMLLLLTPSWLGHMFFNPKDIPFATGMTWTLYYTVRFVRDFPVVPARICMKLGIVLGLTLAVRISGGFSLIYLGLALLAWAGHSVSVAGIDTTVRRSLQGVWRRLLPALVVAYVTMLVFWPWAQWSPLSRPFAALRIFANSPWDLDVLLDGKLVNSLHLPANYLFIYFGVKLPELVLLLMLASATALVVRWARRVDDLPWRRFAPYIVLITATIFPFVFFLAFRPVTYDAIRHFLFVLPPIAVSAALGLEAILAGIGDMPRLGRLAATGLAGYVAWHGSVLFRLHPHEYVYFNRFVGGLEGARSRFELDYWGNSYREATEGLVALVERERREGRGGGPYRVLVCSAGTSAAYFFPPFLTLARDEDEADFYITSTRLDCDQEYDGDVVVKVVRDSAVLSLVKDRRQLRILSPDRMARRIVRLETERRHPGLRPAEAGMR